MTPNWKKIAADRLRTIKTMRARNDRLRTDLAALVERELTVMLHAYCYPRSLYEYKVKSMAETIAKQIVWKEAE